MTFFKWKFIFYISTIYALLCSKYSIADLPRRWITGAVEPNAAANQLPPISELWNNFSPDQTKLEIHCLLPPANSNFHAAANAYVEELQTRYETNVVFSFQDRMGVIPSVSHTGRLDPTQLPVYVQISPHSGPRVNAHTAVFNEHVVNMFIQRAHFSQLTTVLIKVGPPAGRDARHVRLRLFGLIKQVRTNDEDEEDDEENDEEDDQQYFGCWPDN